MAKVASTPRWPLMANCWVKLVAPLASVMVPAASSNNWLKSRLFRGSWLTDLLERSTPPVVSCWRASGCNESPPLPVRVRSAFACGVLKSTDWVEAMRWPSTVTKSL